MPHLHHKIISQRKIITIQEFADYVSISRQTMTKYIEEYEREHMYNSHDIYSILDLFQWVKNR